MVRGARTSSRKLFDLLHLIESWWEVNIPFAILENSRKREVQNVQPNIFNPNGFCRLSQGKKRGAGERVPKETQLPFTTTGRRACSLNKNPGLGKLLSQRRLVAQKVPYNLIVADSGHIFSSGSNGQSCVQKVCWVRSRMQIKPKRYHRRFRSMKP